MAKKNLEDKLTGALVRVRMRLSDKKKLELAASLDPNGRRELSDYCRSVLIPAANEAIAKAGGEGDLS